MNTMFLEFESILLSDNNSKLDVNFIKRKLNMSPFGSQALNEQFSEHRNQIISNFAVNLIDTEEWESKFSVHLEKNDPKKNDIIRKVDKISSKKILQRLNFREEELPNYAMFDPFSGIFFVVNFTLREDLIQKYSPPKIKYIVEHAFFMKSS